MFRYNLASQVLINAPPKTVWDVLLDFDAYPSWNPFIRFKSGNSSLGSLLEVRIQPSGTDGMTFRPVVVTPSNAQDFGWLGRLFVPELFVPEL